MFRLLVWKLVRRLASARLCIIAGSSFGGTLGIKRVFGDIDGAAAI
jgi:hypothetical protein